MHGLNGKTLRKDILKMLCSQRGFIPLSITQNYIHIFTRVQHGETIPHVYHTSSGENTEE